MAGSPAQEHRQAAPTSLGYAVLTVSSSRGLVEDHSGRLAADRITAAGNRLVERSIVSDEVGAIRGVLLGLLARGDVDVVVVHGGTGLSPADLTPEAVAPLLDRRLEGFGELFRLLSFEQVGSAAMLSRALAGIAAGKVVFVVPGSPAAVELAVERLILPEAGHLLGQVRKKG